MVAPKIHLRPATLEDAEGAGTMHLASFVETYTELASATFWEHANSERSVENWRRMLASGIGATLAEVDGRIIGLAIVQSARTRGDIEAVREQELTNLYVLQSYHGTGVGQALLEAVLPGGAAAQLWVARGNPRAVRFYQRNGFTADGAETDGEAFGGIAALRMVR